MVAGVCGLDVAAEELAELDENGLFAGIGQIELRTPDIAVAAVEVEGEDREDQLARHRRQGAEKNQQDRQKTATRHA